MSWDRIGYLAWLRNNASAVLDALGISTGGGTADVRQEVTALSASLSSDTTLLWLNRTGAAVALGTAGDSNRKVVVKASAAGSLSSASTIEQIDGSFSTVFTVSVGESFVFREISGKWMLCAG